MNKAYERINWENYPSENTALNEENLNKMDAALNEVDNRVVTHETTKLDKSTANSMVKDVDFDETTGIFTITFLNGVTKTLDTKLEKIATNFHYDYATQKLILTLVDGTTQEIDMSVLITQYEFENSAYISFTVVNGKVKAEIINGSITADKLQPNFLADVTLQANSAKTSEQNAKVSEENAKQSEINAKNYADSAEPVASTAQGLNPTLDNSTGAPFISFKGDGATEQQAYTGKNLVYKIAVGGLGTGGDVSSNESYRTIYATLPSAGKYRLSISSNENIHITRYKLNTEIKNVALQTNTLLITTTEPSELVLSFRNIDTTNVFTNLQVQIELGETATDYEPYVGGTASPNPSYPQEIYGVGESRNLLNIDEKIAGIIVADGVINTNESTYYHTFVKVEPNTTYTLNKLGSEGKGYQFAYYDSNKNWIETKINTGNPCTFTTPSDCHYVAANTQTTYTEYQLEKGTKATPYKPYGKHSLKVKSTGACIFGGLPFAQAIVDNFNGTLDESEKTVLFYTSNDLAGKAIKEGGFKENTQYTFILKGMCTNSSYKYSNIRVVYTDGTSSGNILFETAGSVSTIKYTSTSGKTVDSIKFIYGAGGTVFNYEECGVFEGVITEDEFEPYTETTADIPLFLPLYEGDDLTYNMDGSGEESHKMKAVVFDGSDDENITSSLSSETGTYYNAIGLPQKAKANSTNVYCTHFKNDGTINRTEGNIYTNGNSIPSLIIRSGMDNTTFKAWLQANPIEVVYELSEPTVTPLTAEQIAEFEKLRSFDGTTHITCEAESEIQYFYDSVSGKAVAMVASKANTELPIGSVIMIEEQNTEKPKYGTWYYLFTQTIDGEEGGAPRAVSVKLYQRAE